MKSLQLFLLLILISLTAILAFVLYYLGKTNQISPAEEITQATSTLQEPTYDELPNWVEFAATKINEPWNEAISNMGYASKNIKLVLNGQIVSFDVATGVGNTYSAGTSTIAQKTKLEDNTEISQKVASFWILKNDEDTEGFLRNIIAKLETEDERNHCVVSSTSYTTSSSTGRLSRTAYVIHPDQHLYSKTMHSPSFDMGLICGEYGVTNSTRFFTRIENVLLFLETGQELSMYDPASFKVVR